MESATTPANKDAGAADLVEQLQTALRQADEELAVLEVPLATLIDEEGGRLRMELLDNLVSQLLRQGTALESGTNKLLHGFSALEKRTDALRRDVCVLDTLDSRLTEVLGVVERAIELRECEAELHKAFQQRDDLATAAAVVSRFRKILEGGKPLGSAEEAVQNSLESMERALVQRVAAQFRQAMLSRDQETVFKTAKLFTPLNLRVQGVSSYILFLRDLLSNAAASNFKILAGDSQTVKWLQRNSGVYSGVLEKLFVATSQIVKDHRKSFVEEFGDEMFLFLLRGLEEEADLQGIRILDKFEADFGAVLRLGVHQSSDITSTVLKHIDVVGEELAWLSFQCQQFQTHFRSIASTIVPLIRARGFDPEKIDITASAYTTSRTDSSVAEIVGKPEQTIYSAKHGLALMPPLVKRIQELLSYYVSLENLFASRSVANAVWGAELSLADTDQLHSTLPDDVFFVLRKCISRALQTRDIYAVCATINLLAAVLTTDVKPYLETSLRNAANLYTQWLARNFGPLASSPLKPLVSLAAAAYRSKTAGGGAGPVSPSPSAAPSWWAHLASVVTAAEPTAAAGKPGGLAATDGVGGTGGASAGHSGVDSGNRGQLLDPISLQIPGGGALVQLAGSGFTAASSGAASGTTSSCSAHYSWPSLINDLTVASQYTLSLCESSQAEFEELWGAPDAPPSGIGKTGADVSSSTSASKHSMFLQSLQGLESLAGDFKACRDGFLDDLGEVMLQPILVPTTQKFENFSFDIDEAAFADFQVNDPYMARMIARLDPLVRHFQNIFVPAAAEQAIERLVAQVAERIERAVLDKRFSLLGSVLLDRDVRSLASVVTTEWEAPLRFKFSKLLEMCEVLTTSSLDEVLEQFGVTDTQLSPGFERRDPPAHRISCHELAALLSARTDFDPSHIETFLVRNKDKIDLCGSDSFFRNRSNTNAAA